LHLLPSTNGISVIALTNPIFATMDKGQISLNKYISSSGFCSRRDADKLIEQARVTINGEIVMSAIVVQEGDVVEIDGEPIHKTKVRPIYIACNKPVGITSTTDVKDKSNIIYFINHSKRIFPVGRLDKDSDGLIFLTNDGDIVNKILRASNHHEKEYIVIVDKAVTPEFVKQMSNGLPVLGAMKKKCFVRQEGSRRFRIILTQGLNRQIRRMCEYLDYKVVSLTRVRIMNVTLDNLATGKWRYLTLPEITKLNEMVAQSSKTDKTAAKPKVKVIKTPAAEDAPTDRPVAAKTGMKNADARKAVMKKPKEKKIDEAKELEEWIEMRSPPKRSTYASFRQGAKDKDKKDNGYVPRPAREKADTGKSKIPGRNAPAAGRGKKAAPLKGKAAAKKSAEKPKGKPVFAATQTQSVKQYIPKKKKK